MARKRAVAISIAHPFHLRSWRAALCFAFGLSVLVLGLGASYLAVSGRFLTLLDLGYFFVGSGLIQFLYTLTTKRGSESRLALTESIIYLASGVFLVNHPFLDSQLLLPILAIFYLVSGLLREVAAFRLAPLLFGRETIRADRAWAAIGGFAAFVFAFVLVSGWQQVSLRGLIIVFAIDSVLMGLHLAETNVRAWEG